MQDGGLADKLSLENPFDPNSKPINLKFNAERPYFNLPQVGLPPGHHTVLTMTHAMQVSCIELPYPSRS